MDRRKKACPNENCETYKKKKYGSEINYCPICGEKLIFVCKNNKCFKPIEDKGPKHTICAECETKREDQKDRVIGKAKKGAAAAGGIAVAAFADPIKKEAITLLKKGGKVAVEVVKSFVRRG